MAAKKPKEEPQLSAQELLEARVDAMMDSKAQTPVAPTATVPTTDAAVEGAPTLPGRKPVATPTEPVATPVAPQLAEPALAPQAAEIADDIQVPPSDIDTPQSDAAIDDIVAQEADEVLAAEDAGIINAQLAAESSPVKSKKHGHPVWWFLVAFFALVVVIVAVMLVNPNLTPSFAP